MENGLALLDDRSKKSKDENWIEANEKGLDKNPDLLNVINEQEEYWINYLNYQFDQKFNFNENLIFFCTKYLYI